MSVIPLRPDANLIGMAPSNLEVEQALLGAILINNTAYGRVAEFLAAEHFANAVHGRIYAAIGKLLDRGQIANPITLKNLFDQDGALAEIGGAQYLAKLAESAVTIINAPFYGEQIVDLAMRRKLAAVGEALIYSSHTLDLDSSAAAIVATAVEQLHDVERAGAASTALGLTVAASLASCLPPDRPWVVDDLIPSRQVTLLTGDGGTGKSILAMQLQVATASGRPWLGLHTLPCRSYGLYAEDEEEELHRRLWGIAEGAGVSIVDLDRMAWHSAAADAAELVELDDRGTLRPTSYYHRVERAILGFGARLVVLDAATNLFGGDEIKRRQVNQFIGLLRRLAVKIDGAVVLIAHPSVQGIANGSGLSGSTHWNNAVRSRLYFEHIKGEDSDPDERTLSGLKANYAPRGQVIRVRWANGSFVALDAPGGLDRAAINSKGERVFMTLLAATYANSTWTSPNPSARNFAPSIFAKHPDRDGLGKPAFEGAMYRLLRTNLIKTENYGRPANPHTRLALA